MPRRRQRGAALLLLLVAVVIAFTAALVAGASKWQAPAIGRRNVNGEVLAQAKAALIGYVAKEALDVSEDVPGRLPCPESAGNAGSGTSAEGTAAGTCSTTAASQKTLGRLPWRTLGVDRLVDADGEPLWYAVSPNWANPTTGSLIIKPDQTGSLSYDGTGNVVAVIFAPGRAISTNPSAAQVAAGCVARNQVRNDRAHVATSSTNPDFRDYLECQNSTSPIDNAFGVAVGDNATNPVINDQAVVVTATEVLNALQGPLAERMQRTVAPLLDEFGEVWLPSPARFLPYAVPFTPPESALAMNAHCGPSAAAQQREGLLPVAANTAPCASDWAGSFAGDGIQSVGCSTTSPATTPASATCTFRYFQLTPLAQLLFGVLGASSVTATLQANAPHATTSFRSKTVQAITDVTVTAGAATLGGFGIAPQTDGDVGLSLTATVNSTNLCKESLVGGTLCSTLETLGLAVASTVSLQFAQLGTPMLAGSKLSSAAKNGHSGPFDLLNPASGDPHYWFIYNEWYRYTYYAVAPDTSAAQAGGRLTVNLFPANYGSNNDKRFVLALMGPAVPGQTRSAAAAVDQYIEGANAATTASPRVFAYQVFDASGNDRMATCPFTSGASICD